MGSGKGSPENSLYPSLSFPQWLHLPSITRVYHQNQKTDIGTRCAPLHVTSYPLCQIHGPPLKSAIGIVRCHKECPLLALHGHPHPCPRPREFLGRMGIGERGTLKRVLRPRGCGVRLGLCREKQSTPVYSGKHIPVSGFNLSALSHLEWGAGRGILSLG